LARSLSLATAIRVSDVHDPPASTDDETQVQQAKEHPAAFGPLYQRYVRSVFGYCYQRLGSRERAEDATSQVFVQAMAALPRYRAKSFRGWLFTIARNVVTDIQRLRPTTPIDESWEITDDSQSPEDLALSRDADLNVRQLLTLLNHDQREVVELRLAGLTGPEIATVLGRRPGAIRATQFRAFQILREFIAADGERS
jgi:RNA polymerase sigma-70 factor, ECF subfamily